MILLAESRLAALSAELMVPLGLGRQQKAWFLPASVWA
jgi:hypothetical protein